MTQVVANTLPGELDKRDIDEDKYSYLSAYASPVVAPVRKIIGREEEVNKIMAALMRPEISNVMLVGPAGSGKTTLVQQALVKDPERNYIEVDVAKMVADLSTPAQMAARIKGVFEDAIAYRKHEGHELVLFIDEFHQIVQLSNAAVEAIKPILAMSGVLGVRVIAATTLEEFHEHIRPNQALTERLQEIRLTPTDQKTTVAILRGMAQRYGVSDEFYDDHVFEQIYSTTERFMPSSVQPRKSIRVLDAMVGWNRLTGKPMDMDLLGDVLHDAIGVDIAFKVDGTSIKDKLDEKVMAQSLATTVVARRLQLVVADLHDKSRPLSNFLFTGPTGVGKTELVKQLARVLFGDDTGRLIRFDMSEFALESSLDLFRSELTRRVADQGNAIVLLDEVEKADRAIARLLLQVLDDGRLSDDYNREVSFLNTYIVMTTNAGSEIFETISNYATDDTGDGRAIKDFIKNIHTSIKNKGFPPELLGRVDEIVPFQPLSETTQDRIITKKLKDVASEVYARHGVVMHCSHKVMEFLLVDQVEESAESGGARGAVRSLQREVVTEVATFINTYPEVRDIYVDVDGQMRNKTNRVSTARVVIKRVEG